MHEEPVVHNTFVIERTYQARVEKVFGAFASVDKKRRWFGGSPATNLDEYSMDFRPGGTEQVIYHFKEDSPFPGVELVNQGLFQDIVPNRRIIQAQRMSMGGKNISTSLVTFEFLPAGDATDVVLTHQGAFLEGSDGPERREGGWKVLLANLEEELAGGA